ncbi:hypothetical protein [Streptomyces sp. DHE17-7]|uniref:hypothetical protein n=1 Tax=Streptomyces sp. DHE17-7 TaxID=2759949 RepID=UPI0022EA7B7D|nr:hypothetical protein [Streptomyces sp. DHE17-7]
MARTEYYDDPNAHKPNSMVVAGIRSTRIALLQRRRDNDLWALPGGRMDSRSPRRVRPKSRETRRLVYPGWVSTDRFSASCLFRIFGGNWRFELRSLPRRCRDFIPTLRLQFETAYWADTTAGSSCLFTTAPTHFTYCAGQRKEGDFA